MKKILSFINMSKGKAINHKQHTLSKAIGTINSYQSIGNCDSELLEFIKGGIK
ncbi:MAG: hypothetical protein U9N33_02935 [Campylobacterota bacterium]|nr:hypothetical protein [Campylobacterota bacterium]